MMDAFLQGLLASSALLVGALATMWRPLAPKPLGLVLAFGSGVLVSSVAYELVEEAFSTAHGEGGVGLGLLAGALTFYVGDLAIERLDASKAANGPAAEGASNPPAAEGASNPLAIVLGTVLDGIPESVVLGVGLVAGGNGSAAFLVAVFLSNLPESMGSTGGLLAKGWRRSTVILMWAAIVLASGVAAAMGYAALADASPTVLAFVLAFAGGALLTMLADSMMPEAFEHGGPLTGVVTTIGIVGAFTFVYATVLVSLDRKSTRLNSSHRL